MHSATTIWGGLRAVGRETYVSVATTVLLVIFGLGAADGIGASNSALLCLSLLFVFHCKTWWPSVRGETWFWWLTAFLVYMVFRSIWVAQAYPDLQSLTVEKTADFLKLFLFVPVMAWSVARSRQPLLVLLAAALGLLFAEFAEVTWGHWEAALKGGRREFRLPANHTAFWSIAVAASSLLALIGLPRLTKRWSLGLTMVFALLLMSLAALFLFLVTKSRGAGVAFVATGVPIIVWFGARRARGLPRRGRWLVFAATLLLGAILAIFAASAIYKRLNTDWQSIVTFVTTGEIYKDGPRGGNPRLLLWREASARFLEKPLLGWGLGADSFVYRSATDKRIRHFDDAHNTPLVLLVQHGLIGCGLLLGFLISVVRTRGGGGGGAARAQWELARLIAFTVLAMYAVMSQFSFWLFAHDARFYLLILFGILLAGSFSSVSDGEISSSNSP